RKRIALTMRLEQNAAEHGNSNDRPADRKQSPQRERSSQQATKPQRSAVNKGANNNPSQQRPARREQDAPQGAMGAALAAAMQKKK
ncbi:MAG: hypothetical protein WBH20_15110, partial [Oceanisphaera sp.]|uniref:hypothetical protein n=1 Tax=Oceanisphaera sp. TaxID=1929979 RepID=UPI003C78B449